MSSSVLLRRAPPPSSRLLSSHRKSSSSILTSRFPTCCYATRINGHKSFSNSSIARLAPPPGALETSSDNSHHAPRKGPLMWIPRQLSKNPFPTHSSSSSIDDAFSNPRDEKAPEPASLSKEKIVPAPQTETLKKQEAKPEITQAKRAPRKFKARKAAMTLTPRATEHLKALLDQPEPKLIRVGVRNRGCSGLSYHLTYVDKPGPFDEEVVQDGVRVLIDSKALFSIIGSEMDWIDDKLSNRFVFKNPNIKGECGCGESFMV